MRKILIISMLLLLFCGNIFAQGKRYQTFGVAFYNFESLFDTIKTMASMTLSFPPKARIDGTEKSINKN